jgi:hypothetical protein
MLDKIEQNIEDLWLYGAQGPSMMEFVEMGMQGIVIEHVHHSHLAAVYKYLSDLYCQAVAWSNSCARRMTQGTFPHLTPRYSEATPCGTSTAFCIPGKGFSILRMTTA